MKRTIIIAIAAASLAISASAARAIDADARLTQLDGTPFTEPDGTPERIPTTFRRVAVNVLLAEQKDEANLSGETKLARFTLAKKIQESKGDLALEYNEATLLKALVQKSMPIVVVGQMLPLIDKAVASAAK